VVGAFIEYADPRVLSYIPRQLSRTLARAHNSGLPISFARHPSEGWDDGEAILEVTLPGQFTEYYAHRLEAKQSIISAQNHGNALC
jgi:hypothetical protein